MRPKPLRKALRWLLLGAILYPPLSLAAWMFLPGWGLPHLKLMRGETTRFGCGTCANFGRRINLPRPMESVLAEVESELAGGGWAKEVNPRYPRGPRVLFRRGSHGKYYFVEVKPSHRIKVGTELSVSTTRLWYRGIL